MKLKKITVFVKQNPGLKAVEVTNAYSYTVDDDGLQVWLDDEEEAAVAFFAKGEYTYVLADWEEEEIAEAKLAKMDDQRW